MTLVIAAAAAAAPTWNVPAPISSGDRALGPDLALNGRGDGLVVWDQEVGPDCATAPAALSCIHIVEATARRAGSSAWSSPVEISRPGVGSTPRVGIDGSGDAAIVWVHDIGRDRVLQATYRRGPTGAFPEPNDLSEPSLEVRSHHVALADDGDVVAVWAERIANTFTARAESRSTAAGGWGAPVTLSSPGADVSGGPELAVTPGGIAVAAWVENGAVRVRRGDGATWGPPATISAPDATAVGSPSVQVDPAGDTIVVWSASQAAATTVEGSFYDAARGAWGQAATIGQRRSAFEDPQATIDTDGDAIAAWVGSTGVLASQRAHGAANWSQPAEVSPSAAAPIELRLATTGNGNAVALWTTDGGAVESAIRPGASGLWQLPVQVAGSGAATLGVALDDSSDGTAVWNQTSSGRLVVDAADLAANGPVLVLARLPRRAVAVGAPARFAARTTPWGAPLDSRAVWQFGDGAVATGAQVTHVYRRAGRFTVTVRQTDLAGEESSATTSVRVVASRLRNLIRPSIRGTPRVGRVLTCIRGTWAGSPPITWAYRWIRNATAISGAKGRRYRLASPDAGSSIVCEVEATGPTGSVRARSGAVRVRA